MSDDDQRIVMTQDAVPMSLVCRSIVAPVPFDISAGAVSRRVGMTLIELIAVISIIATLATMSAAGIQRVTVRARLSGDAEVLVRAHRQARQLALVTPPPATGSLAHFGLAITQPATGGAEIVLLYGVTAADVLYADDDGNGLPDVGGRPLYRWRLSGSTRVHAATAWPLPNPVPPLAAGAQLHWFYRYGVGAPISLNQTVTSLSLQGQDVGVGAQAAKAVRHVATVMTPGGEMVSMPLPALPASPISALRLSAGRLSTGISIYSTGHALVEEIR